MVFVVAVTKAAIPGKLFESDDFDNGTTVEILDDDEWRRAVIYRRKTRRTEVIC